MMLLRRAGAMGGGGHREQRRFYARRDARAERGRTPRTLSCARRTHFAAQCIGAGGMSFGIIGSISSSARGSTARSSHPRRRAPQSGGGSTAASRADGDVAPAGVGGVGTYDPGADVVESDGAQGTTTAEVLLEMLQDSAHEARELRRAMSALEDRVADMSPSRRRRGASSPRRHRRGDGDCGWDCGWDGDRDRDCDDWRRQRGVLGLGVAPRDVRRCAQLQELMAARTERLVTARAHAVAASQPPCIIYTTAAAGPWCPIVRDDRCASFSPDDDSDF